MALEAIDHGMRARKLEAGRGMIKVKITFAVRVAGKTGRTIVYIPIYAGMVIVCLRLLVTACTGKDGPIARRIVTVCALCPLALMGSAVNREMLGIVIKC